MEQDTFSTKLHCHTTFLSLSFLYYTSLFLTLWTSHFSDSDSEAQASKQLIGKRKDKKEKDIGYAALGNSSGDEEEDGQ